MARADAPVLVLEEDRAAHAQGAVATTTHCWEATPGPFAFASPGDSSFATEALLRSVRSFRRHRHDRAAPANVTDACASRLGRQLSRSQSERADDQRDKGAAADHDPLLEGGGHALAHQGNGSCACAGKFHGAGGFVAPLGCVARRRPSPARARVLRARPRSGWRGRTASGRQPPASAACASRAAGRARGSGNRMRAWPRPCATGWRSPVARARRRSAARCRPRSSAACPGAPRARARSERRVAPGRLLLHRRHRSVLLTRLAVLAVGAAVGRRSHALRPSRSLRAIPATALGAGRTAGAVGRRAGRSGRCRDSLAGTAARRLARSPATSAPAAGGAAAR